MKLCEVKNELDDLIISDKLTVKQKIAVKRALVGVILTLDNGDGFDE